jgi:hypothetical protein
VVSIIGCKKNSANHNAPLQLHEFPVIVGCAIGNKPQAVPELHLFKDVNNYGFPPMATCLMAHSPIQQVQERELWASIRSQCPSNELREPIGWRGEDWLFWDLVF